MASKCKRCGQDIRWPQPYTAGARPLEADGSGPHDCPAYKRDSYESHDNGGSGFVKTQQQVQQQPTSEEWTALFDKIAKMSEILEMQARFYEGLVGEMQLMNKMVQKVSLPLEEIRTLDAKTERILARVESITGVQNVREDANSRLRRQEQEFDRDREDGTIGFG